MSRRNATYLLTQYQAVQFFTEIMYARRQSRDKDKETECIYELIQRLAPMGFFAAYQLEKMDDTTPPKARQQLAFLGAFFEEVGKHLIDYSEKQ